MFILGLASETPKVHLLYSKIHLELCIRLVFGCFNS